MLRRASTQRATRASRTDSSAKRSRAHTKESRCWFLEQLQPELHEHVAAHCSLRDLLSLAITCRSTSPLQSSVISARIASLRSLISFAHVQLISLIARLPPCPAQGQIALVIENSMCTFLRVCSCNEDFLRLSRAAALRGLAAPFTSPIDAARLARSCCQTCDDVTKALLTVNVWLYDLVQSPACRISPQPSPAAQLPNLALPQPPNLPQSQPVAAGQGIIGPEGVLLLQGSASSSPTQPAAESAAAETEAEAEAEAADEHV